MLLFQIHVSYDECIDGSRFLKICKIEYCSSKVVYTSVLKLLHIIPKPNQHVNKVSRTAKRNLYLLVGFLSTLFYINFL